MYLENELFCAVKEAPQITAKAGTLRRKQQIRNVLDHLPKDDHDDVFSSSPMQKRIKKVFHHRINHGTHISIVM